QVSTRKVSEWQEEELNELRQLYERFQEADDVVARIVDNLSVKRPKVRVIDKLVEIGVVSDKSQLKKKSKAKKKMKSCDGQLLASLEEYDSDEDDKDDSTGSGIASGREPLEYILLIVSSKKELLGPMKWIADDLKDIASDRESGIDNESVPLVPIVQENHDALENPIFIRLLKALGLEPPQKGQETYWRYPAKLSGDACRKRAQLLEEAFNENNSNIDNIASESDSDNSRNGRQMEVIELAKEAESSPDSERNANVNQSEEQENQAAINREPSKRSLQLDSDDEDAHDRLEVKKSRKTFVIDSDSE
ncbi:hypothetical protein CHUAL_010437, partial [Chamberlinius hualienensis]